MELLKINYKGPGVAKPHFVEEMFQKSRLISIRLVNFIVLEIGTGKLKNLIINLLQTLGWFLFYRISLQRDLSLLEVEKFFSD